MIDVTDATFERDVVERSREVPVVVDLWATWCGPCRTLGPILEKVVAATDGLVELAKVDTDANPGVAQAFQVQSIPAVYAMQDGKVVDGFIGAQPEWAVEEFVRKLVPSLEDTEIDRLVAAGDEDSLWTALAIERDHPGAVLALAELLAGEDRGDEALDVLARIPESAESRRVAALARGAGAAVDDPESRLAELLPSVKANTELRQEFLDILELMGSEDPRVAEWRRRLTTALY